MAGRVQLEKCTEENELIKQWKVIAGQDIPDRERISRDFERDH